MPQTGTTEDVDLVMIGMRRQGIPVTRETYLAEVFPDGVPDPIPPEIDEQLPRQFRSDKGDDEEQ